MEKYNSEELEIAEIVSILTDAKPKLESLLRDNFGTDKADEIAKVIERIEKSNTLELEKLKLLAIDVDLLCGKWEKKTKYSKQDKPLQEAEEKKTVAEKSGEEIKPFNSKPQGIKRRERG